MRLKAQIVIDIEAADFGEAAEHQRRVELAFETVREVYPEAQLDFRQRRRFARPRLQRGTFRVGRMWTFGAAGGHGAFRILFGASSVCA